MNEVNATSRRWPASAARLRNAAKWEGPEHCGTRGVHRLIAPHPKRPSRPANRLCQQTVVQRSAGRLGRGAPFPTATAPNESRQSFIWRQHVETPLAVATERVLSAGETEVLSPQGARVGEALVARATMGYARG